VPGWGLAGLVVVLVGLDQVVQDPGELGDVAGGQGLGEVAADPVGVGGPGLVEPLAPGRGEGDVEAAAVGGADGPGDQPVASAAPVTAKYLGKLAAADVFTFDNASEVFEFVLRVDGGVLGPFGIHP